MKERTTSLPENGISSESEEIDPHELSADEIDLEEIAQRPDWRELLREIVRKEDMDPWNIKVSRLVDEYIQTVNKIKKMDFRVPANVVLASSILLREKSGSWVLEEEEESSEVDIWEAVPPTPDQIPPPREEIPKPRPKKRETREKVGLDELIDAVDQVITKEKEEAKEKAKETEETMEAQDIVPDQLIELAKEEEDFEEEIDRAEGRVKSSIDEENLTSFTEIVEDPEETKELVNSLIALLHLANQGTVSIWQEKVFGEIFIHYRGDKDEEGESEEND